MPQRVSEGFQKLAAVSGVGGIVLTYYIAVPEVIGLTPALNIFNSVLLGVVLLMMWLLHRDLVAMSESDKSQQRNQDDNSDSADSTNDELVTDGGITLSPQLRQLRDEAPEGGGALAGLVAGGAAGLLAGPAGVVVGGLAGGLLGNEAEYQNIVDRYRDELGETAKSALKREPVRSHGPYTVEKINHRSSDDTYVVHISDLSGDVHQIRLDLDSESYIYESD